MAEQPYYSSDTLLEDEHAQLQDDDALLAVLRARYKRAEEAEAATRDEELDDQRFSAGRQWPEDILNRRRLDRRPCLVINQMLQFIHQVTNEQRLNRPAIRVIPADDYADIETARVFQGLIRHIEVDSKADLAYDTAFESAVRSGRGYWRIVIEYADEMSFDLAIKIRRVRNRFTVYLDPNAVEIDGSDAEWGVIFEEMSHEEFRDLYPDADATSMPSWSTHGDGWIRKDVVRVADYFFRHRVKREIVLLDNDTVVEARLLPDDFDDNRIINRRVTTVYEVWCCKTNGYEVLERERFPGRHIPIIPVVGDEIDIDGQVGYSGIVRHAKDAQRMYNFWASSETEAIALAPRAPYVGAEGQFEGHEQEWHAANQQNIPFLEYNPVSYDNGTPVPPPQRNNFEPAVQAITNARLLARDDLKATTGIYDASLGARSNETSGRAIVARQREGDVGNYHYPDNFSKALRYTGLILLEMSPEIYSGPRIVRILGEDDSPSSVQLNQRFTDNDGIDRIHDVGVGRYDVVVDIGPSFATQRQEAVAIMLELSKTYPALFDVAGDLIIKKMDLAGTQEIAERLMSLLPPELRPQGDPSSPREELAQFRAMIPQLEERLQALDAYAKEKEEELAAVTQENVQLKTAARSKEAELSVKEDENIGKLTVEQQKLALEAQKLELEEHRLAIELAKIQADLRIRAEDAHAARTPEDEASEMEVLEELATGIVAVQEHMADIARRMAEETRARQAPKQINIDRKEDGTLVGSVKTEDGETRTVKVSPSNNGYVGETS